jgi:DNA-binding HxlR family transcriptional regulator
MGGTWKPVILFYLVSGTKRFMELTRLIPNATQSMLTSQLRELEADGVVVRHVYPEVPPKVEYRLSELGQTLVPVLLAMRDWGTAYKKKNREQAAKGGDGDAAEL